FDKFLGDRIDAAQQDEVRYAPRGETPNPDLLHLARFYLHWFQQIRRDYHDRWNRDLLGAFRKYQDLGAIELATSAATHCFSPLLETDANLFAQYKVGVDTYKKHFGRAPKGFWLPECAYRPSDANRAGIEKWMHEVGLQYFFTESFVIKGGQTAELRRVFGPYGTIEYVPAPPRPATGLDTFEAFWLKEYPVAVLGRHEEAGFQVWSADHGYPGDGNYREFHKKDDNSGLHYWKLTSKTTDLGDKQLYNPEAAMHRMRENSDHYVGFIQQQLTDQLKRTGKPGLVMVSFDTELFGHWWFEGVNWIKEVIRKMRKFTAVTMQTASEYLESHPPSSAIEIPESSWGSGGHWQVWLNNQTEWMWPIINKAEKTMQSLAEQYGHNKNPLTQRALKQAAREVLLIESSDWPFLVTTGQAKQYAIERFNKHVERFDQLVEMIHNSSIDEQKLFEIEDIDNCFKDISPNYFLEPSKSLNSSVPAN
ncbi:MAG TPA: 1,4-alpha-glucan branching protein domain-containing protein, partial [Chroococcales cyanobacterium]